jgi:hypothetical protein
MVKMFGTNGLREGAKKMQGGLVAWGVVRGETRTGTDRHGLARTDTDAGAGGDAGRWVAGG